MTDLSTPRPIVLAVCGNPIVGRALALLIRDSHYKADFLDTSSLSELGSLEGVQLLLITPTPELSMDRREALLAQLREMAEVAEIPILKLVVSSEQTREGAAPDRPWRTIRWPCRIREVKRQIETALTVSPDSAGADLTGSPSVKGGERRIRRNAARTPSFGKPERGQS